MRKLEVLSPTSLHTWERDKEEFYRTYLSDARPDRAAATDAMSVGSAFDAFVKSKLYADLVGTHPKYELQALFESQVEEHCRDFAWEAGEYLFQCYVDSGAYEHLTTTIECSEAEPRFEFTLKKEVGGVVLLGKPDCWFKTSVDVLLDWKVNGYCSANPTSPKPFYMMCVDTWTPDVAKPTRGGNRPHKKFEPVEYGDLTIGNHWLEDVDKKWADQLAIYMWMLNVPVGSEEVITCIDQLACKPFEPKPLIRVAQHRCRISADWQFNLMTRLQSCWNTIASGHIFKDLTREESDARCEVLDMEAGVKDDDDPFWELVNKKGFYG